MSALPEVRESDFDEYVLDNGVPVLVEFFAPWCGPCRALTPVLERAAQKYDGRLLIVKLNVDNASSQLKQRYNVRSVPRMVLFKNGREVAALLGAHGQQRVEQMIEPHVAPPVQAVPDLPPPVAPLPFGPGPISEGATVDVDPFDEMIQPAGRRR